MTLRRGSFVRRMGDDMPGIVLRIPERGEVRTWGHDDAPPIVLWLDGSRGEPAESMQIGVRQVDEASAFRLVIRASGLAGARVTA